jgi:hypothetical protein
MILREIAHSRAGDKGNIVTLSLIAYRAEDYPMLAEKVTTERVTDLFGNLIDRPVIRHTLPTLHALNFVLHRPPNHSVTRSLALDAHGKCLSYALLSMDVG